MKLKISLSILNGTRSQADIDNGDVEISIASHHSKDAAACCGKAAKVLREAADRFDRLAIAENPFNQATHKEINK